MAQKKAATMKNVAALANVSIATVSRFLNGNLDRMSKTTASHIQDAINQLNYVPNSAARQMITHSSNMVAVVVANIDDYFSTELFKGVSDILEANHYTGVLFDTNSNRQREADLIKTVNEHTYDGLILQPFTNDVVQVQNLMRRNIPVVLVDRELERSPWTQVVTDNFAVAQKATRYFYSRGYTHVVVLTSKIGQASTRRERYAGIKSVAANVDVLEVSEESYNHTQIHQQLVELIANSTEKTLVFALKERWLLEFIPSLIFQGYLDNEHATATAFSDTATAKDIEPRLKLISQNPYLMGASAAEVLVDTLTGKDDHPQGKLVIPAHLK